MGRVGSAGCVSGHAEHQRRIPIDWLWRGLKCRIEERRHGIDASHLIEVESNWQNDVVGSVESAVPCIFPAIYTSLYSCCLFFHHVPRKAAGRSK
jgi:hypothetical protein